MQYWNVPFSELLRGSRPGYWGNWALSMQIKPGAVGIVDAATGDFRLVAENLPGVEERVKDKPASSTWQLSSVQVSREESQVKLDGSYLDPESGTKIDAGLEVKWGFAKAGAIVSEFSLSHESIVEDFGTLLNQNINWLADKAKSVGMGSDGNIAQGFGVLTGVLWANSGLNLGSRENKSDFSISGSLNGINELLGGSATGKGSYVSTRYNKSVDRHIWPDKVDTVAPCPVPIAYTFASFDGRLVIPNWIRNLASFALFLNNNHGGTYIVNATLKYKTPEGEKIQKEEVWGGQVKMISIPLNATQLHLQIKFVNPFQRRPRTYPFSWDCPLVQWPNGQRNIDTYGVWPAPPKYCRERESMVRGTLLGRRRSPPSPPSTRK
jgi:hypothetical protein